MFTGSFILDCISYT